MGQRHSETHNKGRLKYKDIIDSREDFDYTKHRYEVISTYLLKGISCQSINYLKEGCDNPELGEICKETIQISLFGLELKESVSSFGIYEAVNEAFESCKISRPKKLLVCIYKDDDKLCDIHLELQYLQQLALIETKFDDIMKNFDKSQALNKDKLVDFTLYKNRPDQKEDNGFDFLHKKPQAPRQEKRPKGYDFEGNALYSKSKHRSENEFKYLKIKTDGDSNSYNTDPNRIIQDTRNLNKIIEIKDEKFTSNNNFNHQSHSQSQPKYNMNQNNREPTFNKSFNSSFDSRYSTKNNSYDNENSHYSSNIFYDNPSSNEQYYGSDYLSSSAIKEISANPRFKIYANTSKPLLGFFYDTYDYSDDSEFASYFIIGLDSTILDQDILNYFETNLKFKVRDIIRNPLEEESILRLVLYKDQALINSYLGNKKFNTKILLGKKNVMIVEIPHKRKFHPEDFYKNYQIAIELESPVEKYESLFKTIESKIGEILEMRFYQPLRAVITCLDKNSEKNAKADVHFSYSDLRNGNDDQTITFLDCVNKKPISGNRIEISFKYKNSKNDYDANHMANQKNYIEGDLKWPKRPPSAYNFRNTYIPSFFHLFRHRKMWKDFKIRNDCNNHLSVEEFINWYENTPQDKSEYKQEKQDKSNVSETETENGFYEKPKFPYEQSTSNYNNNISNQNNFYSKNKNTSNFIENSFSKDFKKDERVETKNNQDKTSEISGNFEIPHKSPILELDLLNNFVPYKPGEIIDLVDDIPEPIDLGNNKKKIQIEDFEDLIPGKLSASKKIDDMIHEAKQNLSFSKKIKNTPSNSETNSIIRKNSNSSKDIKDSKRDRSNSISSKSHSYSNCSENKMLSKKRINEEHLYHAIKKDLKPRNNFEEGKSSMLKKYSEKIGTSKNIKVIDLERIDQEIIYKRNDESQNKNDISKTHVNKFNSHESLSQIKVQEPHNIQNKIKHNNNLTSKHQLSKSNYISVEEYNELGDDFHVDLSNEFSKVKSFSQHFKNNNPTSQPKEITQKILTKEKQSIISREDTREQQEEYMDINAI